MHFPVYPGFQPVFIFVKPDSRTVFEDHKAIRLDRRISQQEPGKFRHTRHIKGWIGEHHIKGFPVSPEEQENICLHQPDRFDFQ